MYARAALTRCLFFIFCPPSCRANARPRTPFHLSHRSVHVHDGTGGAHPTKTVAPPLGMASSLPRFCTGFGWRTGSAASAPDTAAGLKARPGPRQASCARVTSFHSVMSPTRGGTKFRRQLPTPSGHSSCHGDDARASSQSQACVGTPSLRQYARRERNDDSGVRYTPRVTTHCWRRVPGSRPRR